MTHNQFTIEEILSFAWTKTKQNYWFLLKVAVLCLIISGAVMLIPLVNSVVQMLLSLAVISVSFAIVEGQAPHYSQMLRPFDSYKTIWHFFLATLLYMLIVVAGLILLILPGIYLAVRLKFYTYFILENANLSATESLRKSMGATKGIFWKLFGFNVVLVLMNILGFLALGLGLLFTIPVTIIAYTYLYKKLSAHATHHHETSPHLA